MADDLAADDEERRRRMQAAQRGRDPRRPARVRAVVERERDPLADLALAGRQPVTVPGEDRPERTRAALHPRPAASRSGPSSASRAPARRAGQPGRAAAGRERPSGRPPAARSWSRVTPSSTAGAEAVGQSLLLLAGRDRRRRRRILAAALAARRGGGGGGVTAFLTWPGGAALPLRAQPRVACSRVHGRLRGRRRRGVAARTGREAGLDRDGSRPRERCGREPHGASRSSS